MTRKEQAAKLKSLKNGFFATCENVTDAMELHADAPGYVAAGVMYNTLLDVLAKDIESGAFFKK